MPGLDRCVCVDFGFAKGFFNCWVRFAFSSFPPVVYFSDTSVSQLVLNNFQHFLNSNTLYLTLLHYAILLPEIADSLGSYA